MGEIKSVKVDNWGVFFLQKLQNFFNKTDYCDLTLQFRDNSQLKVHRLVLSACTDFFNVLEQTCELIDDALVMPLELQADVVVPIVNFMYTGTLEFELKMYGKLLKTAKEMNMTVLLKLLEAHKRTMDGSKPGPRPGSPKLRGKRGVLNSPSITKLPTSPSSVSSTQLPMRRMITSINASSPMRRIVPGRVVQGTTTYRPASGGYIKTSPKMQRGPTRFEAADQRHGDTYESSFDAISYESKPLKDEPEEYEERHPTPTRSGTSPFEQLRKGYNNNKRPAVSTFISPPAKKPNIEDVKEFSEQQRMRKQIAAEYGDDAEYDGIMDDEFHNDDDDDEPSAGGTSTSAAKQQQHTPQVQPQASIIIKQSPNEKPTIVVKDSSNSKMDHAKIISEVLRQYPHLVKSNKNIKLKIMPNVSNATQKIVMKRETPDGSDSEKGKTGAAAQEQARQQLLQLSQQIKKPPTVKAAPVKMEVQSTAPTAAAKTPAQPAAAPQKRRIDSKTMHALIAQGAENTTGPWLCLRCGVNGRPISIPSYRGFRRHLINTHKEVIDSALCEHCGWRSTTSRTLSHHMLVEHKIPSSLYVFPTCEHCSKICLDPNDLDRHVNEEHPNVNQQQCIYCNKVFSKEMMLYNHMKTFHKKRAREDGVIDFSDEEMTEFDEEIKDLLPEADPAADKKIKIISDISLPSTLLKLEDAPAPQDDDYANESGPKFVNADGNEMVLTPEQRDEIMSQLEQDHGGGVVMVLNETTFSAGEGTAVVQEEKLEPSENPDETEDAHIYSEFPHEGESGGNANDTSAEESPLEGSKDEEDEAHDHENPESEHDERMDVEHMEWAENVISAHDADEEEAPEEEDEEEEEGDKKEAHEDPLKKEKKEEEVAPKESEKSEKAEDDISLKLKMLTGDWTDDEIEDEEEEETIGEILKGRTEEQVADTADNSAVAEQIEKDHQEETVDSAEKEEIEKTPVTEAAETEEEASQSSQSEAKLEKDVKVKSESSDNSSKQEESIIKSEDSSSSDTQPETIEAIEREVKRTSSTHSRGSSSSTRISAKDEAERTEEPAEKISNAFMEEEPLNVKVTSPKKIAEDPLAVLTSDEHNESTDAKTEPENTTEPAAKPKSEDNLKTVDKVKSLISEWVDDEDDI